MDDNLVAYFPTNEAPNVVSEERKDDGKSTANNSILEEEVFKQKNLPSDVTYTAEEDMSGSYDDQIDTLAPNVVVGKTKGDGKSSAVNCILEEHVFKPEIFPSDVTYTLEQDMSRSGDDQIDTPAPNVVSGKTKKDEKSAAINSILEEQVVKPTDEVRNIILVGRTGNGKSATGNSILGQKFFKSKISPVGVTTTCQLQTVLKDGRMVNVIDTPGLFDFSGGPDIIQKEIVNCFGLAKDGIHAVLVVLSLINRFSREEKDAVEYLFNFFGERIKHYMIVVITGGDELEANDETIEDVIGHDCPEPLKEILDFCEDRYVIFDNRTRDQLKMDEQVNRLHCLVEGVYEKNGLQPYNVDDDDRSLQIKEESNTFANDADSQEVSEMDSKSTGFEAKVSGSYQDNRKRGVENMVKQSTHMYEQELKEAKLARLKEEEKAQADRSKSDENIQMMRKQLPDIKRGSKNHLARKGDGKSAAGNSIPGEQVFKHGDGKIRDVIDTPGKIRNIVLVGRTGNGKSATGNSMLRKKCFQSKVSSVGVTKTCELQTTMLKDRRIINVIDTPGLFDFSGGPDFIRKEMFKCIGLAKDGIHAVLVVLSLKNRFTVEEKDAVASLLNFFSERIKDYMIAVITGGDELEANEETIEDVLGPDCPEPLKAILGICGNRYVVLDNRTRDELKMDKQLNQLYRLVEDVCDKNGQKPYIAELFPQIKEELNRFDIDDAESSHNAMVSNVSGLKSDPPKREENMVIRGWNNVKNILSSQASSDQNTPKRGRPSRVESKHPALKMSKYKGRHAGTKAEEKAYGRGSSVPWDGETENNCPHSIININNCRIL